MPVRYRAAKESRMRAPRLLPATQKDTFAPERLGSLLLSIGLADPGVPPSDLIFPPNS
jgi:hypothetical protein